MERESIAAERRPSMIDSLQDNRRLSTVLRRIPSANAPSSNFLDTSLPILAVPIRGTKCKTFISEPSRLLSHKFLLARPETASLQEIGLQYLIDNPSENCRYCDQKTYVSPVLRFSLNIQGHTHITSVLCALAYLGDIAYCFITAINYGAGIVAFSYIPLAVFNLIFLAVTNKEEVTVRNVRKDWRKINYRNIPSSNKMFVCMKALEFLGQSSGEVEAYDALRKKLVRETVLKSYTLHFLAAALPWGLCIVHTIKSHFQEAEYSLAVLACLVGWAKVVLATTSAATSFIIRLDQKLMILEIERVRQDIRDAFTGDRDLGSVEDVYHLAPRIKKLLVEAHNMCNNTHKFFYLWAPVIFFHMVFLIFGVLNASSGICMPFWIFVSEIQPCMSMIKVSSCGVCQCLCIH